MTPIRVRDTPGLQRNWGLIRRLRISCRPHCSAIVALSATFAQAEWDSPPFPRRYAMPSSNNSLRRISSGCGMRLRTVRSMFRACRHYWPPIRASSSRKFSVAHSRRNRKAAKRSRPDIPMVISQFSSALITATMQRSRRSGGAFAESSASKIATSCFFAPAPRPGTIHWQCILD
ncbi:hypothetical protein SDC9_202113 [bioreactor metagenome]|uniref:Uncharacterized protein n=1 Tax=bioreactor metagenome TaxID=1076179 RepID=A0A645J4N9_9ZZZZ